MNGSSQLRVALLVGAVLAACGQVASPSSPAASTARSQSAASVEQDASQILVGAGEVHATCSSRANAATARLLDGIAGTVFTLGDSAGEDGSPAEYACYDRTWGRQKARTYPAPGNHDYGTPTARGYFGYFGGTAGDPSKGYYSYELGGWHAIVLNSNCEQIGGCGRGSAQEQWLRADLAAHSTSCTLGYWHHPRFSSGRNGSTLAVAPFWDALYEAGAELVLNGHDRLYERFAPQDPNGQADLSRGIRQITVGTAGDEFYDFNGILANSEARATHANGVLKLTLGASGYQWRFVPVPGQRFSDAGSGDCH